ncbi:MAG TPA: bacteriohopanetetrol glucosamine biosynthesis glycosyltransferase HpnI [Candidatus Acidoferrum sp.]|nr:bacteriohopanetetrol glucosamine biosynthesis glycosyltransferase HpnI [Candidatus Acidoferrum sp.]
MTETVLSMLRLAVLVIAAGPLVYYLLSLYCTVEYFRTLRRLPPHDDSFAPPVSILKPVRGVDSGAYENFASYCQLDYPEYELVFAMADAHDPVIPVIEKLQRDFPGRSIRFVTDVPRVGENNKVNSLCRLVKEARHDLLVMTDSDVRVERDYLREVVAPFADARVGAVTSFYCCAGGGTFAADLNMLGMCMDSVPSALVARRLEGKVQFAFGWTMATTKERLAEIGGWEAMANHHSDDFELGNRIAGKGHRLELMREPVWMVFPEQSFSEFLRHELRWAIGLRNVRPAGYAGMIFTHGLPWAILAASVAAASGWAVTAALYVAAYLILRIGLAYSAGVWGLRDHNITSKLWLAPVRDAVSVAVWFAGFFTDRIHWRGLEYRVRNRLLEPVGDARATRIAGQERSARGIK